MTQWPHAPAHFLSAGTFFVTGSTLGKTQFFREAESLDRLQLILFENAEKYECELHAWCLLSNHYHLVVKTHDGDSLRQMLTRVHSEAGNFANQRDGTMGRKVWYQFWDKTLTFESSWMTRIKYTNENAVHHGLVASASTYRWCSSSWFERTARASLVRRVSEVKIDRVKVYDDF